MPRKEQQKKRSIKKSRFIVDSKAYRRMVNNYLRDMTKPGDIDTDEVSEMIELAEDDVTIIQASSKDEKR